MLDRPKAPTDAVKRRTQLKPPKAPAEVYALTAWSVKKVGDKWYVSPTACFENKPTWSKPYATLQRATTAIARKLAEEVVTRQKRREKLYGSSH